MSRPLYLTKSSYVRGLECRRMLWRSRHHPLPYDEPLPGTPAAVGTEIGIKAQSLFPGGVLVSEDPWKHAEAIARTTELMSDPSVPAIFEAAFEHNDVRIRADVLERLLNDRWGLREVKSSSRVKTRHIDDAAVQAFVLEQSGVELTSIELIHVDTSYVYDGGEVSWQHFFKRAAIDEKVRAALPMIEDEINDQLETLADAHEPNIEPGPHCPADCDFWEHCTAAKPTDWIDYLPRLSAKKFEALTNAGIEKIRDIPDSFELTDMQDRVRDVVVSGTPYLSRSLADALKELDGPVAYLDFEAMNPAVPIYTGTRPYQRTPFQWSLHRDDGTGQLSHADFLGDPTSDPRESFTTSLVSALNRSEEPIVVYSAYERGVLMEMAKTFPAHEAAIEGIVARLTDLYVVVRDHVYLEDFNGSLSIKSIGKALSPGFSYDGLELVADGAAAAAAFQQLVRAARAPDSDPGEDEALRAALLSYCRLDTLAMVEAHRGLRDLALRLPPETAS